MRWIKKVLLSGSLGCFAAAASGQEAITLGRATPVADSAEVRIVSGFTPIQPRPSVVRACSPFDDEPKALTLPRDVPLLPAPAVIDADRARSKAASQAENSEKPSLVPIAQTESKATGDLPTPTAEPELRDAGIFNWSFGGPERIYGGADALLWWTRGMHLPPLVTTAAATDPEATRGALGFGTTKILYGDTTTTEGPSTGGRFTLGYKLDDCGLWSVEATYFFLGRNSDNVSFSSSQFPVLARPFFDINDGVQSRQLTTSPGINPGDVFKAVGSISVNTSSTLQGGELNLRALMWNDCCFKITGLVGFRYLDLNENLNITEHLLNLKNIPVNPPNLPIDAGDQITVSDQFHTRNQFFGGQVGVGGEWNFGRWFVGGDVKVGLGSTLQEVDVNGFQRVVMPNGDVVNFRGGLYAVSTNIGHHSQSRFGVVPETNLKLGYNLTDNIRVYAGYDFLYWSSVVRPGDQIDQALDLNKVPNSGAPFPRAYEVRPVVPFNTSSFWATGVNAGIEFRY